GLGELRIGGSGWTLIGDDGLESGGLASDDSGNGRIGENVGDGQIGSTCDADRSEGNGSVVGKVGVLCAGGDVGNIHDLRTTEASCAANCDDDGESAGAADTARHIWIRAGDDTGRIHVRSGIAGPASGRRDRLERRIRRNGLSKYSIDGIEGTAVAD